jgi:membrane-bound metal-dependent hydrolase YbcI (DUF457 family)
MFIGHFGVGFGAKKVAPFVSLGLLFTAAQFLDLLWPSLLLLHLEHVTIAPGITKSTPLDFTHYPISHSLLLVIFWSLLFSFLYWLIKRDSKNAIILFACVVSHWLLDLVVHRPDLPLFPGNSPRLGFGLWNYPVLTAAAELSIFVVGLCFYLQKTIAKNRSGKLGLWILITLLVVIHIANMLGPPPPNVLAIAWAGQLQWLFVILAFWVDHNRVTRTDQIIQKPG